jgi:hypothetical protein
MLGVETSLDLVYDTDRIMFLRSYLTQLQRATSEGVSGARLFPLEPDGQF